MNRWLRFRTRGESAKDNPSAADTPEAKPRTRATERAAGPPTAAGAGQRRPQPADAGNVSRPVRVASEWAWRFLLIAAAVLVVGYVAVRFRLVTFPIIVALLLAAMLQPAVGLLVRRGMPRALAAATV